MAVIGHAAGIPATVILLETPAGLLSGTGMLIGPEQNCKDVLVDEELFSLTATSPLHIVTELGVTVGAGGV